MDEPTPTEFASWTSAALGTAGVPDADAGRIAAEVCPAARAAYEDALVQGLCRDGAREVFVTAVAEQAHRLIERGAWPIRAGARGLARLVWQQGDSDGHAEICPEPQRLGPRAG